MRIFKSFIFRLQLFKTLFFIGNDLFDIGEFFYDVPISNERMKNLLILLVLQIRFLSREIEMVHALWFLLFYKQDSIAIEGLIAIQIAIYFLPCRQGYLFNIIGDFEGMLSVDRTQFINPIKGRGLISCYQPGTHSKNIDRSPLCFQTGYHPFVELVGGGYFYIFQSILIQHSPGLLRKVSQVPAIQPDTLEFIPTFPQLPGGNNGIRYSASEGIVSVNQQVGGFREVFTVGAEGR